MMLLAVNSAMKPRAPRLPLPCSSRGCQQLPASGRHAQRCARSRSRSPAAVRCGVPKQGRSSLQDSAEPDNGDGPDSGSGPFCCVARHLQQQQPQPAVVEHQPVVDRPVAAAAAAAQDSACWPAGLEGFEQLLSDADRDAICPPLTSLLSELWFTDGPLAQNLGSSADTGSDRSFSQLQPEAHAAAQTSAGCPHSTDPTQVWPAQCVCCIRGVLHRRKPQCCTAD